jgi:chromosome segregation ATPase
MLSSFPRIRATGRSRERVMVGAKLDDLRAAVDVVRQLITDWDAFVGVVESLTREHAELKERYDRLLGQYHALEASQTAMREAHEQERVVLTSLRAAHEALLLEHETQRETVRELRARCDELQHDRQYASEELEGILRRLKP